MESVSEGGEGREGREGSEVKRGASVGEGRLGSAKVGEGRAKSSSFFISTMKDFSIFTVQSLRYLKVEGLDFAQDGKLDFLSKIQLSKKVGNWVFEIGIIFKVRFQSTKTIGCHKIDIEKH